jgi:ABC-type uncharacterized transport system permease subunit
MNGSDNHNWQERLRELEAEIADETAKPLEKLRKFNATQSNTFKTETLSRVQNWFANLPKAGKIIVGVAALMVGFSILNTVLKLISAVISLAILAVVLYVVYQFFIASDSST